jgi:hypothetical protein
MIGGWCSLSQTHLRKVINLKVPTETLKIFLSPKMLLLLLVSLLYVYEGGNSTGVRNAEAVLVLNYFLYT